MDNQFTPIYPRWRESNMNTNNGWIKIHRKLLESSIHNKPNYFCLWVTLLMMANHKEHNFIWNGKEEVVKEGQIYTGRKALSKQTGISETSIERILQTLENGHQIRQQKTTKFRLITIEKWKEYQSSDTKLDNKRTTNGHIQECKNEKKDIYIADKSAKPKEPVKQIDINSLYKSMGLPEPPVRIVNIWQDEAANAIKYLTDSKGKEGSIFKCFKNNQSSARFALSDCKELNQPYALYFFKVYNELIKK